MICRCMALLRGEGLSGLRGPAPFEGVRALLMSALCFAKERSLPKGLLMKEGASLRGGSPLPYPMLESGLPEEAIRSEDGVAHFKGTGCIQGPPGARPPVKAGVGHSRPSGPSLRGCVG